MKPLSLIATASYLPENVVDRSYFGEGSKAAACSAAPRPGTTSPRARARPT